VTERENETESAIMTMSETESEIGTEIWIAIGSETESEIECARENERGREVVRLCPSTRLEVEAVAGIEGENETESESARETHTGVARV